MTPHVRKYVQTMYDIYKPYGFEVLEVGSYEVNGRIRDIFDDNEDGTYLGIDMRDGPGVDRIVNALDLVPEFGRESFNMVICCDTLEHIDYWWIALQEMKDLITPGGLLLVTVPDFGVAEHDHPRDYWRFGEDSLSIIMKDFSVLNQQQIHGGWAMLGKK